jgi:hypothetical protein
MMLTGGSMISTREDKSKSHPRQCSMDGTRLEVKQARQQSRFASWPNWFAGERYPKEVI